MFSLSEQPIPILSITQKPPVHHPEYLYFEEKKSIFKTSFDFFCQSFCIGICNLYISPTGGQMSTCL